VRIVVAVVAIVLVVVLGATVLVTGAVSLTIARAFPPTTGSLQLAGLSAPVTVSRDENGLVRIQADTPADLFMAQGYVHASERLWQMDVWRHISAGRLSEVFGSSQLDTDRFIRTLGWRQAAEVDVAAASPDALDALTAYAAGVNAYISAHRDALGPAFAIAGGLSGAGLGAYVPQEWTPVDSAAWGKVQAWGLGGDYDAEIFRVLAAKQGVDPAVFPTLFPPYPTGAPVVVPTGAPGSGGAGASAAVGVPGAGAGIASALPAVPASGAATGAGMPSPAAPAAPAASTAAQIAGLRRLAAIGQGIGALAGITGPDQLAGGSGIGSNDWVVGPSRSATGGALLANDPHLTQSAPSIWFVNQLSCRTVDAACPYEVSGVSFPGVPGVIIGHDARIAWGLTNVNPDVQDLFIETADPADPSKYLTPTGSVPFVTRTETIRVAGGDPVTMTVRQTADGPILNDVVDGLKNDPELYALRWTATDRPDRSFATFLALDRAQGWDDFRAALSTYGAPSQNFVYADVDGHIGYQMPGAVPIRKDGVPGWLPAHGATGEGAWTGTVAFDDLPRLFDPPAGLIVTANAAPVDASYPFYLGRSWDPGWRASRITELLGGAAGSGGVTVAEVSATQNDDFDTRARDVIPYLAKAKPATADGLTVLQEIAGFDGRCTTSSVGCAAYETFEYALLRYVFDDDLGSLARDYVGTDASRSALRVLLADPANALWDRRETAPVEDRDAMLSMALDQAGRLLRAELGRPGTWTWGRLHTIAWDEQTLGTSGIGPLAWLLDVGPYPAPATGDAVNSTAYSMSAGYADPADPASTAGGLRQVFATTSAPSMRLIVDMTDLDGSRIIHAPGQSGAPFSRHYSDMADDWLAGRSVPLHFSPAAWDRAATETLTLTP